MNPMKAKSWKTSAAGFGAIVSALGLLLSQLGEGKDLATAILAAVPAILGGIGLLTARDNDKSSEDVGAAPEPPNVTHLRR